MMTNINMGLKDRLTNWQTERKIDGEMGREEGVGLGEGGETDRQTDRLLELEPCPHLLGTADQPVKPT